MDYNALAAKFGGTDAAPGAAPAAPDLNALAAKFGGSDYTVIPTTTQAQPHSFIGDLWSGAKPVADAVAGLGRGTKDVLDTGADWLSRGFDKLTGGNQNAQVKATNDQGKADFEAAFADNAPAKIGQLAGQIIATSPVGGVLAAPIKLAAKAVPALATLADAVATSGMSANGAKTVAGNLATRAAGGAITGGTSAALADPGSGTQGTLVGGAAPLVLSGAGAAGKVFGGFVRPFFKSGQEQIARDVMDEFAADPKLAGINIAAAQPVVQGSAPTTVAASGDVGLAGLSRTVANASPDYNSALTLRGAQQNQARLLTLDQIAGNPGKIAAAQAQRDAATDGMRDAVLAQAGNLPAAPLTRKLDSMLVDPQNAGKYPQQALQNVKTQLGQWTDADGNVDARALYAMRKDINDVLQGKLQGEAGNLGYASSQLIKVKGAIDDAIDMASRRVQMPPGAPSTGTAVTPYTYPHAPYGGPQAAPVVPYQPGQVGPVSSFPGGGTTTQGPRWTWADYLKTYSDMSKPIDQMKTLQDVVTRIKNGTNTQLGDAQLSSANLNNILNGKSNIDLSKLTPAQMDELRRVSADMNASQLSLTAGKSAGSNTVQNLASDNLLNGVLRKATVSIPGIGRGVQEVLNSKNQQILGRLGDLLLDPAYAAQVQARGPGAMARLSDLLNRTPQILYQVAPLIGADRR